MTISLYILPFFIIFILSLGLIKKVPIYEEFINGGKEGFQVAVSIMPYLVAIIVGISMFKASGAMDSLSNLVNMLVPKTIFPSEILPMAITRSLSGSATLGLFSELANSFGPDAYITKLSAIIVGSSETTFYVISVYFGSIGIKKFKYAIILGLIADFIGLALAILVARLFFPASM